MGAVHTFVAEIFGELIHTLETTDDQTFQIQLIGNAQIQWYVKRIVVRNKRACGGTTGDSLQNGGLHLHVAMLVEIVAR